MMNAAERIHLKDRIDSIRDENSRLKGGKKAGKVKIKISKKEK